jgi:potassium/hydrogen antiporter
MNTLLILLFVSGIFLLGFFGNLFFKKTKISDLFFLILIGYLLASVLKVVPAYEIELLNSFTPIFGALALIILLFEGGLHLNFYKVINELGNASGFTLLVFSLTVGLSGVILNIAFGYPFIYGFLIGAILGGVSSAVVIPLVKKSSASENTKTLLTLESAMTDALCVIITIAIVEIIVAQTASIQGVVQSIFSAFAIATVIGVVGGIFWLRILRDFHSASEYSYLLTLSFLFFLYVVTEFIKGNGSFCALVFGLVLGNAPEILKIFRMKEFTLSRNILQFQNEISLFIKTFFFVYLGLIVDLGNLELKTIFIVIAILIISIISRIIVSKLLFSRSTISKKDQNKIVALHARGLAAAVLATYPLTVGVNNIYTNTILPIAFLVIVLTNLTTTIGFFICEKKTNKTNSSKKSNNNSIISKNSSQINNKENVSTNNINNINNNSKTNFENNYKLETLKGNIK